MLNVYKAIHFFSCLSPTLLLFLSYLLCGALACVCGFLFGFPCYKLVRLLVICCKIVGVGGHWWRGGVFFALAEVFS